jgi:hypothetical protein
MTDALVEINDRLAAAARASGAPSATFHCECGDCLAEDVRLSLDEHDEVRAREDLIFVPGHDVSGRYRLSQLAGSRSRLDELEWSSHEFARWRHVLMQSVVRTALRD